MFCIIIGAELSSPCEQLITVILICAGWVVQNKQLFSIAGWVTVWINFVLER